MATAFLDTNIILRYLLADHPEQSPRATDYLSRVEEGTIKVHISEMVIFEVVFTLERHYHQPKIKIREALLSLLALPGVILPGKRRFRRVFDLYVDLDLPFADAHHVMVMEQLGADTIVSFDRHFDRVPGVRRLEP